MAKTKKLICPICHKERDKVVSIIFEFCKKCDKDKSLNGSLAKELSLKLSKVVDDHLKLHENKKANHRELLQDHKQREAVG